jgi:VWFA-related protein
MPRRKVDEMRLMATCVFAGLLMCAALVRADQAPQHQTPPQFRAAVDLTRIDATVLDKRTRLPIRGLTADDFVVNLSGQPREVASFAEIEGPPIERPDKTAVWRDEASHDIVTNAQQPDRLFVIVMDDAFTGRPDPFYLVEGRRIAHAVVDSLGPGDRAAVVFAQDNRHAVDFTDDRAALRRAIETYIPRPLPPWLAIKMSLGTLQRSRDFLTGMSGYRRAVVWVTLSAPIDVKGEDDGLSSSIASQEGTDNLALRGVQRAVAFGGLSAVPVYAYRTAGLEAPRGGTFRIDPRPSEYLQAVAAASGGHAYVDTNAPSQDVSRMFAELSSYYALGFVGDYTKPGALRRLQIEVKHKDAVVVPASLVYETPVSAAEATKARSATGLLDALAAPLASGAIPLQLATLPWAVAGAREQALALTLQLPALTEAASPEAYTVRTFVFDGEGRREILQQEQVVTIPGGTDATAEVVLRMPLRPGRYNVRVYVDQPSTGLAGSVYAQTTVPDFARERLSLSGVAIGRAEGRPIAGREALVDLLPFAPTTARAFAATDRVGALWRVHQSTTPAAAVTTQIEIVDAYGEVVFTQSGAITGDAFAQAPAGTGVEQRLELPLRELPPGDYLLRVVATAGEHRAQRDVRFSVK